MEPTRERKEEIKELVIAALNGMGSHFFHASVALETREEAIWALNLWPHASQIDAQRPWVLNIRAR